MEDNVGTIVIGTKVNTKGLNTGVKEIEKAVKDVENKSVEVDVDINSKIEEKFKKLYSKYEKGTTKKQYVQEEPITKDNVVETIQKMQDAYKDLAEQADDFNKTKEEIYEIIGGLENYSKVNEKNKKNINELQKMQRQLTLQMNMQVENMRSAEEQSRKLLSDEELRTAELDKQIGKNNEINEQLKNRELTYKTGMKSSEGSVDASAIIAATGGEAGEGAAASATASAISMIAGKAVALGKKLLSIVGSVLGFVVKIGFSLAGIVVSGGLLVGAFATLTKSITKILEENKQLVANFKYIAFMVSTMIDNIAQAITGKIGSALQGIANIIYTILVIIGKVLSAIFKIDLFAGITNDNFQKWNENISKASGGLNDAVGSAKDLKKQLAGFDEMNVLQEPTSGGASGGGGGVGVDLPMPDFKDFTEIEVPEWLQWILDNKDLIIAAIFGIAGAVIALKLGINPLLGLGIGIAIAGIVLLIKDIIKFIQDPSWENFSNILIDLAILLAGVAIAMLAVNAANPVAWIMLAIAAIVALAAVVIKHWDEIKAVLGKIWNWIDENVIQPVIGLVTALWNKIVEIFTPIINFISTIAGAIWEVITTIWNNIKITIDNTIKIIEFLWDTMMQILKPIFDWIKENIIEPVWNVIKGIIDKIKNAFKTFVETIKKIFTPIIDFFKGMIDTIWGLIKKIATTVGDVIGGAFKGVVNGVLGAIESILNFPINAINKLIDVINAVPGIDLGKLDTFNLPRLATGGIINQPGRGVPVGIGGEAGREGVLPLTDTRAMQLLGQEIGKWITVNANIINTMNGRVISRELQKINNENDFAFNS